MDQNSLKTKEHVSLLRLRLNAAGHQVIVVACFFENMWRPFIRIMPAPASVQFEPALGPGFPVLSEF